MKISEKIQERLDKMLIRAGKMFAKKTLASDIQKIYDEACSLITQEMYASQQSDSYLDISTFAYNNKTCKAISKIVSNRSQEQGNMTVGELIEHLSKFEKDSAVKIASWVSCMTDAGTDLGGDEDHRITDITDLETRVVISVERD